MSSLPRNMINTMNTYLPEVPFADESIADLSIIVKKKKKSCRESEKWKVLFAQDGSHSLRPHGLWPARLHCLWTSPGKNTGFGSHSPLQEGELSNPGIKPGSPTLQADCLPSEPPWKPQQGN